MMRTSDRRKKGNPLMSKGEKMTLASEYIRGLSDGIAIMTDAVLEMEESIEDLAQEAGVNDAAAFKNAVVQTVRDAQKRGLL